MHGKGAFHMRHPARLMFLVGLAGLLASASHGQNLGPRDSTIISSFLAPSRATIGDVNGDCHVSDVDFALLFHQQMSAIFGPGLVTGDLDGDGAFTTANQVLVAEHMLRASFGEAAADDAFFNLEGVTNTDEITAVVRVGSRDLPSDRDFESVAFRLHQYMLAIEAKGPEFFSVDGFVPTDHLRGVSSTWPPSAPRWWPANHLVSISHQWNPEPVPHDSQRSNNDWPTPQPDPHAMSISSSWPSNHTRGVSRTYPASPEHQVSTSRSWPPSHDVAASSTWTVDPPHNHDKTISRAYWPGHSSLDSRLRVVPPSHQAAITSDWGHGVNMSSDRLWPPNHHGTVSLTWGPPLVHNMDRSASFPPSHLRDASRTWAGPEFWPLNHTASMSAGWGEPSNRDWPLFPPDHSWFTTMSPLLPRWRLVPAEPPLP